MVKRDFQTENVVSENGGWENTGKEFSGVWQEIKNERRLLGSAEIKCLRVFETGK